MAALIGSVAKSFRWRLSFRPTVGRRLNFLLAGLLIRLPPEASAATYIPVGDGALADSSPLVALVVVRSSETGHTEMGVTDYRVEVVRRLKGDAPSSFRVRVAGGFNRRGEQLVAPDAPRFEEGERLLLFLQAHMDGTYRVMQFMLGAFHEVEAEGRRIAVRDLLGTHALTQADSFGSDERARDFELFANWLASRSRGSETTEYRVDTVVPPLSNREAPYRLHPSVRWFEFDQGGVLSWHAHQTGQAGLPGGGFSEFQQALQAWTNDADTPIQVSYPGASGYPTSGLRGRDSVNAILFNDPGNDIAGSFSCGAGTGTLAYGYHWVSGSGSFRGASYGRIVEGDVVVQDGAGCFIAGHSGAEAAELFTHELGHTLGVNHSCGDAASGPCDSFEKDDAVMRAIMHADGRGARLGTDDQAAVRFLYQIPVVTISLGDDITIQEGNCSGATEGGPPNGSGATIRVSLSEAAAAPVTFSLTHLPGTATGTTNLGWEPCRTDSGDVDYLPGVFGTLTFQPGQTALNYRIGYVGWDSRFEKDEDFSYRLSGVTNAVAGRSTVKVTILNDDPRPMPVWHPFFAVDSLETPYVGDFNGDRKTDIITFTRQNPSAIGDVYVALSSGTGFGTNTKWHDFFAISTDEVVVIADYDGDGKDDIGTWLGKTSKQVYVARSLGNGMAASTVWVNSIGSAPTDYLTAGDANGDGKDDLIMFARTEGKVYVAISEGTRFGTPTVWHPFFAVSAYERPRAGDINGDGRADIVTFATNSPTAFGDVYTALSNGSAFRASDGSANSDKWHDFFAISPSEEVRVGDLNNDRKDDFFTFLPPPFGQCYSVLSLGNSMAPNVLWREEVVPFASDVPFVGDVNGDGRADIIVFAQKEGKVYISLAL